MLDDRGVTAFDRLRTALAGRGGSRAAFLYAFDLLELNGEDPRRYAIEGIKTALLLNSAAACIHDSAGRSSRCAQ